MTAIIHWHEIDTVLLDMDGTLLDLNYDNYFWQQHLPRRYAQHHELHEEIARDHLTNLFIKTRGTMNWYCLDYWSTELDLDIANLKTEVAHLIAIHPHVLEFLDRLRAGGRKAILVTNAHQKSLALKLKHTALDNHLDTVICAHDLGLPKEQPEFWSILGKHIDYQTERTLLIDDNLDVLRSAQQAGIAQLLAIGRPDSKKPLQSTGEFNAIEQFCEILPVE